MGALNTKLWAEAMTTGSPGSPEAAGSRTGTSDSVSCAENSPSTSTGLTDTEEKIEGSDDVDRTPIQLEKSAKSKVNKSESEDDDDDVDGSKNSDDDEDDGEEATDASGQELLSQEFLSTPTAIDKQLHKFKVHGISVL